MPGVERFEDLIAWQKARELTRAVYMATCREPFTRDSGLKRQIQRAAVSVMSNIAEGFERHGAKEFKQFLSVAKASCAEVRSLAYVAGDVGYLSPESLKSLLTQAEEVTHVVTGLRSSLIRIPRKTADTHR